MNKLLLLVAILLSAVGISACKHNRVEAEKEQEKLTLAEFDSTVADIPMYVHKAYKIIGKDTLDMIAGDQLVKTYQDAVYLIFSYGSIHYYPGAPIANTRFPATARTFDVNMLYLRPVNLTYHWDDTQKTVVVESVDGSIPLPIITPGKKAYLDVSKFNISRNMEEVQNAIVPKSMTFVYGDIFIEMRPMFPYEPDPFTSRRYRWVTF